jgi:hypothetical protein
MPDPTHHFEEAGLRRELLIKLLSAAPVLEV